MEYDGTPFSGWQRQGNATGVQEVLEGSIQKLIKHKTSVYAAGRTDTGVHATHQVVHFNTEMKLDLASLPASLNFFMRPHPVVIVSAHMAQDTFHARFSAKSRSYIYRILNRQNPSVLLKNRTWHVHMPLNEQAMQRAAQLLVGKHDFTSFRSAQCQSSSPVKSINVIKVTRDQELIDIYINAPSFLHNQVRIITGALKKIGDGSWTEKNLIELLEIKDRTRSAPTAPACGLYLSYVEY